MLLEKEYEQFAETMASVKLLSSYSSSFGKHIKAKKFGSFKLHNYHMIMQQLMPLALRGLLKPRPYMAIMQMCKVFRKIYTKVYNPTKFNSLQLDVIESMALLEMEFPQSSFDIMTHHPYHLVQKLNLCGPLSTRWMYPVEKYMKTLKNYVQNMARSKACMA